MKFKEYLNEGKVAVFDVKKLKAISSITIKRLLDTYKFRDKRIAYEKDRVGGTQQDTRLFIKDLIELDKNATKENKMKITKDQLDDYAYLKSI